MMLGFLVKGLLRDRSRSLFPLLTVAIGVSLVVLMDSYLRGATDAMFQTTASFVCGHVRVTTRARAREGMTASNELALLGIDSIVVGLRRESPEAAWTPRIRFGGLVDVPDSAGTTRAQSPAFGLAVDFSAGSPEHGLLRLERAVTSGRLPAAPDEVLLSEQFARRLGVAPGDRLTLVSSTMNGSMSVHNFTLAGTVRFGVTAMDRSALLADIRGARHALDMEDAADEVLGFLPGEAYDDRRATALADGYNAAHQGGDDYAPVMETLRTASGLDSMFDLIGAATALIATIFVVAMSVVLWNAGLMGSLRRYGEIGIRLAVGESRGRVYRALLAEAFVIGLAGSALGTLVGLG
ncbi:FtsX-like permease family protein, partial [candidate division WOR-3 bacterium]|nr:FtsX-like permease family protein [candidate division WOR-3 bacterium]